MTTETKSDLIERLLDKPYWLIDIMPCLVPDNGHGQYFAIERFYRESTQTARRLEMLAHVLMKLNCYYDICVGFGQEDDWTTNPEPEKLMTMITELTPGKPLYLMVEPADAMFVLDSDDTYWPVYNASPQLLQLLQQLVHGTGFYVWQPSQPSEQNVNLS